MTGRAILGTILAVVGLGLLLQRMEVVDFGELVSIGWPLILIFVGALKLFTGTRLAGAVLVLAGALFQARALGWLPGDFFDYFWPVALILAGVWLLASRGSRGPSLASEDYVRQFVAFGGIETRNESEQFRGASVTAMFGGLELDLRGAKIAGDRAVIEATAMFGGVEIRVPREWKVIASGTPLLGGWENKAEHREEPGQASPTLEIKGIALFGGVEIGN